MPEEMKQLTARQLQLLTCDESLVKKALGIQIDRELWNKQREAYLLRKQARAEKKALDQKTSKKRGQAP